MTQDLEQWVFFSKILPERASVSMGELNYTVEMIAPDLGLKCRIERVAVVDSQIITRVTMLEGQPDVFTLRNVVAGHLRSLIDLLGFLAGRHYDIEVTSVTSVSNPDDWYVFGNTIPALLRAVHKIDDVQMQIALSDNHVMMALADFRKAMSDASETGFYCYRAVESVMQCFHQPGDNDGQRWERMRAALNVDRAAIDIIKPHADGRRHGKAAPAVTDTERLKIFLITQALIDRLFALKAAGIPALAISEFPQITESTYEYPEHAKRQP